MKMKIVYVSGGQQTTIEINEDNFNKAKELEDNLDQYFTSDDYWIDTMWLEDCDSPINEYKSIFYDGKLLVENIEEFFNMNDSERIKHLLKVDFIKNYLNTDVTEDLLNSVYIKKEENVEYISDNKYPVDLAYELFKEFYPELLEQLENINCDNYLDYCLWFRDLGYNGGITFNIYRVDSRDYVVYTLS